MNKLICRIISLIKDPLKRSMLLSMACKPLSMMISLVYTPLLLNYLGTEKYGLWATVLSVVNWINFFDIGIGNGLRNQLASELVKNDTDEARSSVSTAYISLTAIATVLCLLGAGIIGIANVKAIFSTQYNLKPVLWVSLVFICINFVLGLCKTILYSLQKAECVSVMAVLVQLINALGIIVLSLFSQESMWRVALLIGSSSVAVNILYSARILKSKPFLKPQLAAFDNTQMSKICTVGIKFFLIQIAAVVLYSTDNMIITHYFGAEDVTPYNTTHSAFNIIYSLFLALQSPLWSKFTVLATENEYKRIRKIIYKLDATLVLLAMSLCAIAFVWKPISMVWLGRSLTFPRGLIPGMALYFILTCWSSVYSNLSNGLGKVKLQLILAVGTAIINIPLSVFLGRNCGMGTTGVLLATVICMVIVVVPMTIWGHHYLNRKIKECARVSL